MLERWKQKAIQMNLRKAVIFFIVTSFVLILASLAAVYGNFHSRMNEQEKFSEADREHDGDFKERKEKDWEDISKSLYLSAGDLAFIAGCGIIGMVAG